MPQISNFRLPSVHRFFTKNGSYIYGAELRWGPPTVHLGANGVPLVKKKWVKTVKNYHAPKFEFSTTPRSLIFRKNWKLRLWRQITVETPHGPSWGQWDPIGSKKWVKTVKKLPCLKIRIFDYSAVNNFSQKMEVTVMAPNYGGYLFGPSWGQWGPIGSKKWVKAIKKYHAPNFEFSTTPRSSIFTKNGSYGFGAKSRWGPPRVHLVANGVPLGPKNGSKPKKNTMPQISNFPLPRGHRFFTKNGKYGYGAKSRWGPPRVHLGVNGDPLGPKNGSKP